LTGFGYTVKILEARNRLGGRMMTKSTYKDGKLSTSVDMGAMIVNYIHYIKSKDYWYYWKSCLLDL
jgi:monoamine oxidase